jgi:hypothetical protein
MSVAAFVRERERVALQQSYHAKYVCSVVDLMPAPGTPIVDPKFVYGEEARKLRYGKLVVLDANSSTST